MRPLVLILPKMSGYVKTFKVKDRGKCKNNKLISFPINDEKLLENYKTIWTKIEGLQNIELNALPGYDHRYLKTKIRTYGNKVYTNFHGLDLPEGGVECESFIIISIDSLLGHASKYYLQVYLDNCTYKIVNAQMLDYLDIQSFWNW